MCDREHYLKDRQSNKDNAYRKGFAIGMGKQIELRIPRDRLGLFQPMVLALRKIVLERSLTL
ncbi:transposase [Tenacibaculum maritimum]|uniref:transposase n=1 Tax=Tenacibaculum maritimum TaxID=107401 RepID=UPI00132FE3FA